MRILSQKGPDLDPDLLIKLFLEGVRRQPPRAQNARYAIHRRTAYFWIIHNGK